MDDVIARYQAALRTGHQLAAEGRFKDALTQYEEAARVADFRALPHVCVGGMQMRLGHAKEALVAYERAIEREPNDLDAISGRAAALLATGRRAEAATAQQQLSTLRELPAIEPGAPLGMQTPMSRAETMAVAGEHARDANQPDAAIDAWLAESREHAREEHYDAALDAGMRALSLDTGSARVQLQLARVYFQRGWSHEGTERAAALHRLLELAPDGAVGEELDELERQFSGSHEPPPAAG